jgi:hypothetical protein
MTDLGAKLVFGLGVSVAPAHVSVDHLALPGVGAVIGGGGAIADHIQLAGGPAAAEQFEEGQELPPALTLADPLA